MVKGFQRFGAALALGAAAWGVHAIEAPAPYTVTVMGEARVDSQGLVLDWQPLPDEKQPPAFLQALRANLLGRQLDPGRDANGQPGEMEAGLRVRVQVHPAGAEGAAQVRITGLAVMPVVLDRPMRPYPPSVRHLNFAEWEGRALVRCRVGAAGECEQPAVEGVQDMPEAFQRYIIDSSKRWVFKPIRINGQPIALDALVPFVLLRREGVEMPRRR
ncbi:hypothetical protein [Inhella gelatinilytica]|uniref:TonB C-terminal domain-containing protein n=1 Tax=Inhella gelatinilytica TaxID=2795030 RepID=A0A931IY77_9BURK|nr:hypothetical protein [Inhella gelatinilytica]MBH9552016.1 hypothetical protein [Inhella gelatinilytica]